MQRLLHGAALTLTVAYQVLTLSPARVYVELPELVGRLVQRVQRVIASGPRWADGIDRAGARAHPRGVSGRNYAS
jgi:hypothetical protein